MSVAFSEAGRAEFERLLTRYPDRKAVILPRASGECLICPRPEMVMLFTDLVSHIQLAW